MEIRPDALITILGMALVSYLLRASGLWLMGRITPTPRIEAWLKHIPGAVLISLVAPTAFASTPAETGATLLAAVAAWRTANLLVAMVVGVVAVYLLRLVL